MSQQTAHPKSSEPETGMPHPIPVKKTPLRDLPNENNIVVTKSTVFSKEGDNDCAKVIGTKRLCPDSPANPPHHSPGGNSANCQYVYVRRKPETESSKNTTEETNSDNGANNNNSSQSKQILIVTQPEQEKIQLKEPKVACLPALAPVPPVSNVNCSSGKNSVPQPEQDRKKMGNQNWEERYVQLQMFLKKLEKSSLDEYLEKLRALPAAELSRHAVELEKRSIQLSLEEATELKRVKALDVLGKSKSSKPPAVQPEPPQSLQQA